MKDEEGGACTWLETVRLFKLGLVYTIFKDVAQIDITNVWETII